VRGIHASQGGGGCDERGEGGDEGSFRPFRKLLCRLSRGKKEDCRLSALGLVQGRGEGPLLCSLGRMFEFELGEGRGEKARRGG